MYDFAKQNKRITFRAYASLVYFAIEKKKKKGIKKKERKRRIAILSVCSREAIVQIVRCNVPSLNACSLSICFAFLGLDVSCLHICILY